MSTSRPQSLSLNEVLDELDGNESDFSQGGCSNDSDDDDDAQYTHDADPNLPESTSNDSDCDYSAAEDDEDDYDNVPIANRMKTNAKEKTVYRWLKKSSFMVMPFSQVILQE